MKRRVHVQDEGFENIRAGLDVETHGLGRHLWSVNAGRISWGLEVVERLSFKLYAEGEDLRATLDAVLQQERDAHAAIDAALAAAAAGEEKP